MLEDGRCVAGVVDVGEERREGVVAEIVALVVGLQAYTCSVKVGKSAFCFGDGEGCVGEGFDCEEREDFEKFMDDSGEVLV